MPDSPGPVDPQNYAVWRKSTNKKLAELREKVEFLEGRLEGQGRMLDERKRGYEAQQKEIAALDTSLRYLVKLKEVVALAQDDQELVISSLDDRLVALATSVREVQSELGELVNRLRALEVKFEPADDGT